MTDVMTDDTLAYSPEDVHTYFGLTYANYLVWPRSLMQSMPDEWQARFVGLADELEATFGGYLDESYRVHVVGDGGRFIRSKVPHYERGRTRVDPLPPSWMKGSTI